MISAHSLASMTATGRREFIIKCSFVQIYNEQILDLFNPSHLPTPSSSGGTRNNTLPSQRAGSSRKAPGASIGSASSSSCGLKLRWSVAREFYVENLRILECQSPEKVIQHFQKGIKHKVLASHRLNAASSRSHCVFTIYVESFDPSDNPNDILQSKLALVDLAGSECIDKTGTTGVTLQESIGINKSLFVLRQVIQALSEESTNSTLSEGRTMIKAREARDRAYIPYRDSKLTSLLKYSLGGNSLTLMIACLSPSDARFDENLSTLVYASKAQCVANKPMKNEDPKTILIHELKQEVEGLRKQLAQAQGIILSFQQLGPSGNLSPDLSGEDQQQAECSTCNRVAGDDPSEAEKEHPESSSSVSASNNKAATAPPEVSAKPQSSSTIRESATTKKLKLNVIDNVEMIKQLYATEKALTDRARAQSSRIEDLEYETRVLNVENQSLRNKMEVLEYLIADLPQRTAEIGGGDGSNNEPEEPEEIPGYGTLTTKALPSPSPSLPRVGSSNVPSAERIREVLCGSRKSNLRRQQENDQNGLVSNQNNNNQKKRDRQPKTKRKDLETGLLSLNELKGLLGGKKQSDQQSSSSTNSNNNTRSGRAISNGRQQQQHHTPQANGGGMRSKFPAPPPPIRHSASSSGSERELFDNPFVALFVISHSVSCSRSVCLDRRRTKRSIEPSREFSCNNFHNFEHSDYFGAEPEPTAQTKRVRTRYGMRAMVTIATSPQNAAFMCSCGLSLCHQTDPLDSLSELNRLLQVKATLRHVTTSSSADTNLLGIK